VKFRLLEIESIQHASSRDQTSGYNRPAARRITFQISSFNPEQLEQVKQVAALFARVLEIESYSQEQLTVTVDLSQFSALSKPQTAVLKSIRAYAKSLQQNLVYHQEDWTAAYGFDFSQPRIMGVVNVTPDSFSDGGKYLEPATAVDHALQLIEQGVDIIDIGGESSRPGAEPISVQEETNRVLPVIRDIRKKSDIPISIDTYKAQVARSALESGANWINDISGMRSDSDMIGVASESGVPVVIMHMKGTPETMQADPTYENVVLEIVDFFDERIRKLRENSIDKIVLDPGIGFGKQLKHNIILLRNLQMFKQFGYPVLIGTSRKAFIGAITGQDVDQRESGTMASVVWSVLHGVNLVRVHAVAEIQDTLKIINTLYKYVNYI
jgi:dihydropteroate synthase